ncbi:unnamed protein product, partial [Heterosigma akashiwo]
EDLQGRAVVPINNNHSRANKSLCHSRALKNTRMRFLFNLVWFWACLGECSNVLKFVAAAHEDQYFLPKNGASRSQLQSSNTQLNWLELKGGVAGGKAISMKKRTKKQQEGKDIAAVVPHQVQSKSSTILRSQLTALVTVDSVLV